MPSAQSVAIFKALAAGLYTGQTFEELLDSDVRIKSAFRLLPENRAYVKKLLDDPQAVSALVGSSTGLGAVLSSPTGSGVLARSLAALGAVLGDGPATEALAASPQGMASLAASRVALLALAASPALTTVADDPNALEILVSTQLALETLLTDPGAIAQLEDRASFRSAVVNSADAMGVLVSSERAMRAAAQSQPLFADIVDTPAALARVKQTRAALSVVYDEPVALDIIFGDPAVATDFITTPATFTEMLTKRAVMAAVGASPSSMGIVLGDNTAKAAFLASPQGYSEAIGQAAAVDALSATEALRDSVMQSPLSARLTVNNPFALARINANSKAAFQTARNKVASKLKIQRFTDNGTWTPPVGGYSDLMVLVIGGCGGAHEYNVTGNYNSPKYYYVGHRGQVVVARPQGPAISSPVSVTVGQAGVNGYFSPPANPQYQPAAAAGGESSFGSYVRAAGGLPALYNSSPAGNATIAPPAGVPAVSNLSTLSDAAYTAALWQVQQLSRACFGSTSWVHTYGDDYGYARNVIYRGNGEEINAWQARYNAWRAAEEALFAAAQAAQDTGLPGNPGGQDVSVGFFSGADDSYYSMWTYGVPKKGEVVVMWVEN